MTQRTALALGLLIGLQVLDVLVHVATGQIEVIRIISNTVLSAGAVAAVLAPKRSSPLLLLAAIIYTALNVAFLAQHGLVNPATEALRVPLFVFVTVSVLLAAWLARTLRTPTTEID